MDTSERAGRRGVKVERLADAREFRVGKGEPDPRGWPVVACDGRVVGRVYELLVDTAARKVRFLDCGLAPGDAPGAGAVAEGRSGVSDARSEPDASASTVSRHVLIPISYARLDEGGRTVIIDAIDSEDIARLPEYRGVPPSVDEEERALSVFTNTQPPGAGTGAPAATDRRSAERRGRADRRHTP